MSKSPLTHLDESGAAHMVDISDKAVTTRVATAQGTLHASSDTIALVRTGQAPKGDVLATARIAAIQAVKRTSELIPLCHILPISKVACSFDVQDAAITVEVTVKTAGQTGVEMEALTGCSIALLTLYDMLKAVQKDMVMSSIMLLEKTGGKSGDFKRASDPA
ncbi:MAG: cyclic pyranopterin monophosphate synthase MoaC [Pseudomonadota bacterium]